MEWPWPRGWLRKIGRRPRQPWLAQMQNMLVPDERFKSEGSGAPLPPASAALQYFHPIHFSCLLIMLFVVPSPLFSFPNLVQDMLGHDCLFGLREAVPTGKQFDIFPPLIRAQTPKKMWLSVEPRCVMHNGGRKLCY